MKATILLNYDENTKKVEEEEKSRFLRSILEELGAPIEEFWEDTDLFLSVEQKMKLRNLLQTLNIQVVENSEDMQIFAFLDDNGGKTNVKIAEWFRPTYKIKKDHSQLDPRKKMFLEMNVEFWSVFEESDNPQLMETD